jgi:hypothetical protein
MTLDSAGCGLGLDVGDGLVDDGVLGMHFGAVELVGDEPVQPWLGDRVYCGEGHGEDRFVAGICHATVDTMSRPRYSLISNCSSAERSSASHIARRSSSVRRR